MSSPTLDFRDRRHRGVSHLSRCVDTDWPSEVLHLLFTSVLERSLNLPFDLAKYLVTDEDAAGLSQSLKPRRYIHPISVHVTVLFNDYITEVQTDAQL